MQPEHSKQVKEIQKSLHAIWYWRDFVVSAHFFFTNQKSFTIFFLLIEVPFYLAVITNFIFK